MRVKDALQLRHHGRIIRMIFGRRKGAAAQTASEALPIEGLFVGQIARGEFASSEETADVLAFRIRIFHALVIKAEKFERSEEHTSELQSHLNLVCRLLLEKKKKHDNRRAPMFCCKTCC